MKWFTPTAKEDCRGRRLVEGECEVLRPLTADELDLKEVGEMFRIRQADGEEVDAFADELSERS